MPAQRASCAAVAAARTVHDAGIAVTGRCVSEDFVHEDELEFRIIDWVTAND